MKTISTIAIGEIRARLTAVIGQITPGHAVLVERRDEPVVALIHPEDVIENEIWARLIAEPVTESHLTSLARWLVAFGETPETANRVAQLIYAFGFRQLCEATVGSAPGIDPKTGNKRIGG